MSDIPAYARAFFHSFIKEKFGAKPNVYTYLVNHERKDKCIDEITAQIRMAEISNIRHRLDLGRIQLMAEAGARMFCSAAIQHAEERALSGAERQRRIDNANRLTSLADELIDNGIIQGETSHERAKRSRH